MSLLRTSIDNAGLVLLSPFLPQLFKHLNFLSDDGSIKEDCSNDAIFALEAICKELRIGRSTSVLTSCLCGMQPEQIDINVELSQRVKAEVETCLQFSISSWPALKNVSNSSFRQNFLNRNGAMTVGEELISLRIERHPSDVLLDQLPWSRNLIQTPWMTIPMQIEWSAFEMSP